MSPICPSNDWTSDDEHATYALLLNSGQTRRRASKGAYY